MRNVFYSVFLTWFLFCGALSFAVPEQEFNKMVREQLYPAIDQWSKSVYFIGSAGIKLHYRVYDLPSQNAPIKHLFFDSKKPKTERPVVIIPGWAESNLKYMELAYDLIKRSYHPVYVLDHRGQGGSERLLEARNRSHVEDFSFYVKDMITFMDAEVLPRHKGRNLYLIAHSMGGTISILYMMLYPSSFRSAVIGNPMLRINFPYGMENLTFWFTSLFQPFFSQWKVPIISRDKGMLFVEDNRATGSQVRYEFGKFIENKHQFYMEGPTFRWVSEAIDKTRTLRKYIRWISTPVLLLNGENDKVVDIEIIGELCQQNNLCSSVEINGARHELFMETDDIRDQVLKQAFHFFSAQKTQKESVRFQW